MRMPTMNAESVFFVQADSFQGDAAHATGNDGGVSPQACAGTPCLRLPAGRFCVNLPVLGRRCVNIPRLGSWRIRCCTKWSPPFFSCGLSRC